MSSETFNFYIYNVFSLPIFISLLRLTLKISASKVNVIFSLPALISSGLTGKLIHNFLIS